MLRTTTLPAAALLGLTLLAPTGGASAAETCQGQAATIVGSENQRGLVGTEGPDVIVTNGAIELHALGGDDIVCITGRPLPPPGLTKIELDTGPGDDSVEAATQGWGSFTYLGEGADTFVATNNAAHWLYAGTAAAVDREADVIRLSGPGGGSVQTGQPSLNNPDVVEISGGVVLWNGHQSSPGPVIGGGSSTLYFGSGKGAAAIDARSGTATSDRSSLTFTGFTGFEFSAASRRGSFSYRGSRADERLTVRAPMAYDRYVVMGGGDDRYSSDSLGGRTSWVRGSGGDDFLLLNLPRHEVNADMYRARVVARKGRTKVVARATGFEDLSLAAKRAVIDGTRRGENIFVVACRATVRADAGKDLVAFSDEIDDDWDPPRCGTYRAYAHGGRGNDRLIGGPGNDRLIGGPGRDRVEGGSGRDVCQGEQRRGCEVRR